jgi:hypothetical protein
MSQFHDYETYQWHNYQYQNDPYSNTYNFDWRDDQNYENQHRNNPYPNTYNFDWNDDRNYYDQEYGNSFQNWHDESSSISRMEQMVEKMAERLNVFARECEALNEEMLKSFKDANTKLDSVIIQWERCSNLLAENA